MNKNIKYIIENKFNFNPVGYSDEDTDLIDNQTISTLTYKYFPKTRRELEKIIVDRLRENTEYPYLNDIDTSKITDMSNLFDSTIEGGYMSYTINSDIMSMVKKLDLSNWDTSNVKNMQGMFYRCESLEKLNISTWDTSNVVNMAMMFSGCSSLKHLDLSSFNTSSVTNMAIMFSKCSSLIDLDLSTWDTSNVTDISFMFNNCKSLKYLDLSNWNTFNVTKMNYIFGNCTSLNKLDLTGWNISNITNMFAIFLNCESLNELNLSGWNISTVAQMKEIFYGYEKSLIPSQYRAKLTESKLNFNPADYNDDETDLISQDEIFTLAPKATNIQELKLLIAERLKVNPKNPDLRDIDVSDVKTMKNLFYDHYFASCGIEVLNLSTWDMSKVRNMSGMFRGLRQLKTIKFPFSLKDARPVNMSYMFAGCLSLQELDELDILKFNTCKVTDMSHMFEGCASLTNLQLSCFNTSNVKDMSFMFSCCYLLATLNLRYFDTSKVQKMNNMFYCCQVLEGLDLSNFNTNNVTNMSGMFWNCGFLTRLNVSGFVTKNVTNMSKMFAWCKSLRTLDLSSFTIDNIASLESMFNDCYSLEKLDLSGFEEPGKPYISKSLFSGCSSLKKENVITGYNRIKQMIKKR